MGCVFDAVYTLPPGFVNVTAKAGDAIIIPETLVHGVLKWKPKDRDRRFLFFRYVPQYLLDYQAIDEKLDVRSSLEEEVKDRLAPETLELIQATWHLHEKEISKRDVIRLI